MSFLTNPIIATVVSIAAGAALATIAAYIGISLRQRIGQKYILVVMAIILIGGAVRLFMFPQVPEWPFLISAFVAAIASRLWMPFKSNRR